MRALPILLVVASAAALRASPPIRARALRRSSLAATSAQDPVGPSVWSAVLGIAVSGNPWEYMLRLKDEGYDGVARISLGPFGEFFFLQSCAHTEFFFLALQSH